MKTGHFRFRSWHQIQTKIGFQNEKYNLRLTMENKLDIYKDFAQRLRRTTLNDVYIIVNDDITPQLKKYVRRLTEIPFEEGLYNAYYGAVKKIITSFINYYSTAIDKVIVDADKYSNVVDKNEILALVDRTINIHAERQVEFGKDYLPVRSAEEKTIYDGMQDMYDTFVEQLYDFKAKLEKIDKQDSAEAFAQEHYKIAVQKTSDVLDFAHSYIAMFLADRIKEIRTSLEEIYVRLRNNLRQIEDESEHAMNNLMLDLYDQNKEMMKLSRQYRKNSMEVAEITRTIEKTRGEIDVFKYDTTQSRLEEEVEYWSNRIRDFNEVADVLTRLRKEKDYVEQQREIYATRTCTELPGAKGECWARMGATFDKQSEQLKEKLIEAGKCLVTFFGIRGVDRIFYESDLGKYYLDEFNHQVYIKEYGLKIYHLNCKGDFFEVPDQKPYCFDEYGRYIQNENGEKIHQIAACTSEYNLNDDELLVKVTKDCGHSEAVVKKCKMRIKDPNDVEIIPDIDPIDLHKQLNAEVIKYLWDSFGYILPEALHDVFLEHTKNPIHNLAHKLLHYKYHRTRAETKQKKKEAEEFRIKVYRDRETTAKAASVAWKAKQMKRSKPEESDNSDIRAAYYAQMSMAEFINSLAYYYD